MLWEAVRNHDLIFNIRTASVSRELGLMALELEGPAERIEAARRFLEEIGVTVEPLEKNVIE